MIRKLTLGLVAAVSLTAAALAPTSASAFTVKLGGGWHPHHHHQHFGYGHGPSFVVGGPAYSSNCFQPRRVQTRKGLRWRTVNVCAY
jgi:hypothetical protein